MELVLIVVTTEARPRFQSSSVGDDGWNAPSSENDTDSYVFQSSSVGDDGWNWDFSAEIPNHLRFNPHPSEMTDGTRRSQPLWPGASCFNPHPSEMTDGTRSISRLVGRPVVSILIRRR